MAYSINPIQDNCYPGTGNFDFAYYKAIHHLLFSDLYDLAGQVRTVNIGKKGTCFCPALPSN